MVKHRTSWSVRRLALRGACFLALAAGATWIFPANREIRAERVRDLMLRTWFHGVDDEVARQILEPGDVAILRSLVSDPDFPRRDNVVAFLAHSGNGEATDDLLAFLEAPPADVTVPEEDRALLLAPQALGRIAARGDQAALTALLEITSSGSDGGVLASAAARAADPEALRADLFEMAFRGLAFSRSSRARSRLQEIAGGWVRLPGGGRDLANAARDAIKLFDEQTGRAGGASGPVSAAGLSKKTDGAPAVTGVIGGESSLGGGIVPMVADTQSKTHRGPLTYANHPAIPSLMTDARLDLILDEASLRAGRSDFTGDVSCCTTVARSGTQLTFGTVSDGLDIIGNQFELEDVLNNTTARVHVVRAINYCGSQGTNIIGCAWVGGNGMSLVRMTNVGSEAVLWIHEYGHNVGLNHVTDNRGIMFGTDTGGNNGLVQAECNTYHNPVQAAGQTVVDIGTCSDLDADAVHDVLDNCPGLYNFSQPDADADDIGDLCDPDDDNDGVNDGSDCAALNGEVWGLPGEVTSLLLTHDTAGTTLNWTAPADAGGLAASLRYDTMHSGNPANFNTGYTCNESNAGPDTTASASAGGPAAWTGEGDQLGVGFGTSVAFADVDDNGIDDMVIGIPRFNNGQDQEGRVVVYPGIGTLTPGSPQALEIDIDFSGFGTLVAAAGDVDNDSFNDIFVGATDFGYVYGGSPSGLLPVPIWSVASDQPGSGFGGVAASAGDVNNDGYDDLIVGAPQYDNGQPAEGRVFLYLGSSSGPELSASWTASGSQSGARFGASLSRAGDMNHDGYDDVLIGAPGYDNGEIDEGRVYLIHGSPSGLSTVAAWSIESDQASAELGSSVAGGGDINGDTWADLVIGARLFDNGQTDEGLVMVLAGSAAGPVTPALWMIEGDQAGAQMGSSVSAASDLNGDGLADVLVGASGFDNVEANEGRVYAFLGAPWGILAGAARIIEPNQVGAAMGNAIAGRGDLNDDGVSDILLGVSQFDAGQLNEGRAFLYGGTTALAPAANVCFYYLVRAENFCGSGPLGYNSDGVPVTGGACP